MPSNEDHICFANSFSLINRRATGSDKVHNFHSAHFLYRRCTTFDVLHCICTFTPKVYMQVQVQNARGCMGILNAMHSHHFILCTKCIASHCHTHTIYCFASAQCTPGHFICKGASALPIDQVNDFVISSMHVKAEQSKKVHVQKRVQSPLCTPHVSLSYQVHCLWQDTWFTFFAPSVHSETVWRRSGERNTQCTYTIHPRISIC